MKKTFHYVRSCCIIVICSLSFVLFLPTAEAGLWSTFKEFTELPSEVGEIKQQYEQTLNQLDQAKASIEQFQIQNNELLEQNKLLNATVTELQLAEEERKSKFQTTKMWMMIGVGTLIGYFLLLRTIRFFMRRAR